MSLPVVGDPDAVNVNVNVADVVDVALAVACTDAEGPGKRFALWLQGCTLGCPGCCNPHMWAMGKGTRRRVDDIFVDVDAAVAAHGVEGVSLLGGEPFLQPAALARLARGAQERGLSVMIYTGFTLAELRARADVDVDAALAATDVLVDGRYVEAQRTTARRFVGSENQVMHFFSDRYTKDDPRFASDNTIELRLVVDKQTGTFTLNGWPSLGARTR